MDSRSEAARSGPPAMPRDPAVVRNKLLALHRTLIDVAQREHEAVNGRVGGPNDLLRLLTTDAGFAWLRKISGLIVELDEALDQKDEPATAAALASIGALIHPPPTATDDFARRYRSALQRDPDAAIAHAAVARAIGAPPIATQLETRTRSSPRSQRSVARVVDAGSKFAASAVCESRIAFDLGSPFAVDPFLRLTEEWLEPGAERGGPKCGFESITLVLGGRIEHDNSRAGRGELHAGDVLWISAGSGVVQRDANRGSEAAHLLELWLNLPRAFKSNAPSPQELRAANAPVHSELGVSVRVHSGAVRDERSNTANLTPVTMLELDLEAGARFAPELERDRRAFVYVVSGSARIGAERTFAREGQTVWIDPGAGEVLEIAAETKLRAVFYAAVPLGEPIVADGSFVLNSAAELERALDEFTRGGFGA